MPSKPTTDQRFRQAARWYVKLDAGPDSIPNDPEFVAWLAQGDENRAAYAEVCATWLATDQSERPGPVMLGTRRQWSWSFSSHRLAASVTGLAVLMAILLWTWRDSSWPIINNQTHVMTARLEEGSRYWLSPGTKARFHYDEQHRRLEFTDGEIFLDVTTGTVPFELHFPNGQITVLGTRFGVAIHPQATMVGVTHGQIQLQSEHGQMTLTAGQTARITSHQTALNEQAPGDFFAWVNGNMVLQKLPLSTALERLEPYSDRTIWLLGQHSDKTVQAVVALDQVEAAILGIIAQAGLHYTRLPGALLVY